MNIPSTTHYDWVNQAEISRYERRLSNPLLFKLFLLTKLPLGWFASMRLEEVSPSVGVVSLPYGWRTQNPFQSIYFAAQCMAGELCSGIMAMMAVRLAPAPVSVLLVDLNVEYTKKATSRTWFRCEDGAAIFEAVDKTLTTGQAATVTVRSVGTMADGTIVSRFELTWSFKKRA